MCRWNMISVDFFLSSRSCSYFFSFMLLVCSYVAPLLLCCQFVPIFLVSNYVACLLLLVVPMLHVFVSICLMYFYAN